MLLMASQPLAMLGTLRSPSPELRTLRRQQKTMSRAASSPTHGLGSVWRLWNQTVRYTDTQGGEWRTKPAQVRTSSASTFLFIIRPPPPRYVRSASARGQL
jgi:hypothetical protein